MIKKTNSSRFSTFSMLVLLGALCLLLTACGCEHEWKAATCEDPKTCELCGETKGEAEDHDWEDATCEAPKTCEECGKTKGEPLGHTWVDATCEKPKTCSVCEKTEGEAVHTWVDATCEAPKTCSVCEKTEGEALSHTWVDATTEAPKTCSVCEATEGERIITDSRFTTAACKDLFGTWQGKYEADGDAMGLPDFTGVMKITVQVAFSDDGEIDISYKVEDKKNILEELKEYFKELLYADGASMGLSKEETDTLMKSTYNMTTDEYAEYCASMMDVEMDISGNYYVKNGKVYAADSWDEDDFNPNDYTLVDGVLTLESFTEDFPGLTFEKVSA